jgi:predicted kinase
MVPDASHAANTAAARGLAPPLLVIVTGIPGAGKSTLAHRLGQELRLPVLMKDTIKEALLETLGAPTRAISRELSRATYAVLSAVAATLIESGTGVVLESNYRRGLSEPELRRLVAHARAVQVHCAATHDAIEHRYRARAEMGLRHPGHFDAEALPDVLSAYDSGEYDPLDLNIPLLRVDTTDGYGPPFATILERIREV